MSNKILVLQGLLASGKSTFAKILVEGDSKWVRVNRDDLRTMFHMQWSQETEFLVKEVQEEIVRRAIRAGYSVIIDDTNLAPSTCERWKQVASFLGCPVEFKPITTPLEECIRRDSLRPNPVGEKIIRNLYDKYLKITI